MQRGSERRVAERYFGRLRIRAPSVETAAAALSGGNQQKIVLARWLAAECRVLLLDEPTRGIDVAAKAEIHALSIVWRPVAWRSCWSRASCRSCCR